MLSSPILLAMLAGASAATWTLCLKLGSTRVTAALGALVVTSGAFVMNAIVLLVMRGRGHEIVFDSHALWLMVVAGVAAAGEIAVMIAYLAGPEAGFVTGASLSIDGGFTAGRGIDGVSSSTKGGA